MSDTQTVTPEMLASSELLRSLPDDVLEELAKESHARVYAPGEVIFNEGDTGESLHIVQRGLVRIVHVREGEKDFTLQTLGPGKTFGELAVLDPAPRSAGAIAIDETVTVEVGREELNHLLDTNPGAARKMMGALARSLTLAREDLKRDNTTLEEVVQDRTKELRETQLEVIRRLGLAAEFRDDDTGLHISRMSQYCAALAEAVGLSKPDRDLLLNAAPMHDIGKIGIPDRILLKPGKLEDEEFELMKTHTTIGSALLSGSKSDVMKMAQLIALNHHERWDGRGYPHGIVGDEIPMVARICSIADVFDALTSQRPYKKAWDVDDAFDEIKKGGGAHFDPHLAEVFDTIRVEILRIKAEWDEGKPKVDQ